MGLDQYSEIDTVFDILDAKIDPYDMVNQKKKANLMEEIDHEKRMLRCKYLFKYGRVESDPFKLWS
jgi:hypothetical protein